MVVEIDGVSARSRLVYSCSGLVSTCSVGPDLDDLAVGHHGDTLGQRAHQRQVVGDEQHRQAEIVLELDEELDDGRLDEHVERRGDLVADEHRWPAHERPSDGDALTLAAAELIRIERCVARR